MRKKVALVELPPMNELIIVPPVAVPRAAVRTMRRDFRCNMLPDSNLYHYLQANLYRPHVHAESLRFL